MNTDKKATIFKVQTFSINDGPGTRDTVFFKGCNLHCYWCHNPESWSMKPEIQFYKEKCIGCNACNETCKNSDNTFTARFTDNCKVCGSCVNECFTEAINIVGYDISAEELFKTLEKDIDIFNQSGGGVTFSGGEPLLQSDFLLEILKMCKQAGIHTAMESAVCVKFDIIEKVLPYLDFVFCDIKTMDEKKHIEATGVSNKLILENIMKMSERKVNLNLRTPIIPNFNDDENSMNEIADFIKTLPNTNAIELLPFHGMCVGKYKSLNREYKAKDLKDISKQTLKKLSHCFSDKEIDVKI